MEKREPEKLPEGWAYYTAAVDFITPWGPRYVKGQAIKLSADQAEQLADKNVLEEHAAAPPPVPAQPPTDDNTKKGKK
jgi:hypothetical protein